LIQFFGWQAAELPDTGANPTTAYIESRAIFTRIRCFDSLREEVSESFISTGVK